MKKIIINTLASVFIQGCIPAQEHRAAVQDNSSDRITVGKVQREIKKGMSSAKVVEVLGSPNIVSTDKDSNEVWIYDKVSTNIAKSESSGSLLLGGWGSATTGGFGISGNSGATSSSQKTLTIIIKFDNNDKVKDFSYRTSSF
jgi:outer membrane protein assembly factor BamE (lipoprotein component of BamABCDE complex)